MRYITPEHCITSRLAGRPAPNWAATFLVCRDYPGSQQALATFENVRPVRYRLLYNMTHAEFEPLVFEADVAGRTIAIVTRVVWGGPQMAILVEELAALSVKFLLSYGIAGSIDPALPKGSLIVAASALPTDGTSKAYGVSEIQRAETGLVEAALASAARARRSSIWRRRPSTQPRRPAASEACGADTYPTASWKAIGTTGTPIWAMRPRRPLAHAMPCFAMTYQPIQPVMIHLQRLDMSRERRWNYDLFLAKQELIAILQEDDPEESCQSGSEAAGEVSGCGLGGRPPDGKDDAGPIPRWWLLRPRAGGGSAAARPAVALIDRRRGAGHSR